jgi:hypothetical protein
VTSWSGQTRGGWAMVPAQGPLVDGGWYEGWLVDCASTGTPRFVEEDDVRFLCEARGGWAIVPTQGPLGNKSSKWFRVFYYSLLHGLIRSAGSQNEPHIYMRPAEGRGAKDGS